MLMSVFSIYDSATEAWSPPLFVKSKGEIMRWFTDAVNDVNVKFCRHPADYTLFELGTWDDDNCGFSLLKAPIRLAVGIELQMPEVAQALKEAVISSIKSREEPKGSK
jgi:hypothetical protein